MKITRRLKGISKSFFNFSGWMGKDQLVNSASDLYSKSRSLFSIKQNSRYENFEDALHRMGITEKDLLMRAAEFRRSFVLFFVITICVISYAFYLLLNGNFFGFLISLGLAAVGAAMTFRYHFWLFQIQERRLGCTISEWINKALLGRS